MVSVRRVHADSVLVVSSFISRVVLQSCLLLVSAVLVLLDLLDQMESRFVCNLCDQEHVVLCPIVVSVMHPAVVTPMHEVAVTVAVGMALLHLVVGMTAMVVVVGMVGMEQADMAHHHRLLVDILRMEADMIVGHHQLDMIEVVSMVGMMIATLLLPQTLLHTIAIRIVGMVHGQAQEVVAMMIHIVQQPPHPMMIEIDVGMDMVDTGIQVHQEQVQEIDQDRGKEDEWNGGIEGSKRRVGRIKCSPFE